MDVKVHAAKMPPKQTVSVELYFFSWTSFHFGMHMTCPAQCQLHLSFDRKRRCEDSDALYRFVTRIYLPVHVEDGI